VFLVGLLNTLVVAIIGIFSVHHHRVHRRAGRLSRIGCCRGSPAVTFELVAHLPLLFQILFWYRAVLASCRTRGKATRCSTGFSQQSVARDPRPVANPGLEPVALAVLIAITGAL